jgi:hypothetical protein
LEEIKKVVDTEEKEESSAEYSNESNQERSKLALIAMYGSNVALRLAMSASRSLISGDTAAKLLFDDVPNSDLFNGDMVIFRGSAGSFATIDSASGSISRNSLCHTSPMNFAFVFP